ncbi:hypothetical protein FKP32DRAFT_1558369 [Trametes sanguinea]|nr:hypothetical protein FKP32DRAFT_1561034 [Trametes sanguinea]KAI9068804.1 hypothetical protein FKP32DRAFT_1560973 [Trametes sanguinea]KAI9069652.1 hypothetical protein FKP32DRAFT_1559275 [Trametes sanguinea]KAI9070209.1 hypothetical protein FKP32DRAFT_1558369 [Trametes sanguinea]
MTSKTLTYTDADVPPPPSLSFSQDIAAMNRIWDDDAAFALWDHSSPLVIAGVSVPVSYWRQNLIHEYRKETPERFWLTFSKDDGEKKPLTTIVRELRSSRKALDQSVVNIAREHLGPQFDETFTYRKGGKLHVCRKPSTIAKLYGEMKR